MSISVTNITKEYGNQKALDNVSFNIAKGEIVGFLGPNGAGKSTLMKILTTYIKATEGAASVNDYPVSKEVLKVQKSIRSMSKCMLESTWSLMPKFIKFQKLRLRK
jgi:ABC-2 type transport system ATP-binding protein